MRGSLPLPSYTCAGERRRVGTREDNRIMAQWWDREEKMSIKLRTRFENLQVILDDCAIENPDSLTIYCAWATSRYRNISYQNSLINGNLPFEPL